MYIHTTFNLNPRAVVDRHAAALVHPVQARRSHAPERGDRRSPRRKNCVKLTKEIFGDEVIHTPWMRPGFELGLAMQKIVQENPQRQGRS